MKSINNVNRAGSLVVLGLFALNAYGQSVGTGRVVARFGVDGDLSTDTSLNGGGAITYGPGNPKPVSDDWFFCPNVKNKIGGMGIIDVSDSAVYRAIMQSSSANRSNLRFTKGMSVPKLTRSGGYILLDALYAKDHVDNDKSAITNSVKVIDDPNTWDIGTGSVNTKTDIMEFYTHVRRMGLTVYDSLFFYFGVGIHGNSGNKNVTAELFVNDVQLDTVNGVLTGLGSQGGRVAWRFDNTGKVKVIGDMIVELNYSPSGGGSFGIHPRIWMSKSTYDSLTGVAPAPPSLRPSNFDLGPFTTQGGTPEYGYADVEPKGAGTVNIGEGTANDISTCLASPWGTVGSSNTYPWSRLYDNNQFVEFSANLTAMGVDPALFDGIDPCTIPYRSIAFYSHTSSSANSNPEDFAGPYPFWRYPAVPHLLTGAQNITCNKDTIVLKASTPNNLAFYGWDTNGDFVPDVDDTILYVTTPGTYSMRSSPLEGCWGDTTTVTIYQDKVSPIATLTTSTTWEQSNPLNDTFDILDGDPSFGSIVLYGGNLTGSIAAYNAISGVPAVIPAVTANDFTWKLTRYNGGANTLVNDTTLQTPIFLGDYYTFILNGTRNGCSDTHKILITQLPVSIISFDCTPAVNGGVNLKWSAADEQGLVSYQVQRMSNGRFVTIGTVSPGENPFMKNFYSFTDLNPAEGWNTYRLSMVMQSGNTEYSPICMSLMNGDRTTYNGLGMIPNPTADVVSFPVQLSDEESGIQYAIHNALGVKVMAGNLNPSGNVAQLNVNQLPSGVYMVMVEMNGRVYHEKLIINR